MNLANRSFTNIKNGSTLTIKESYQNIAITIDNKRVDVRDLMNPSLYKESSVQEAPLDANSFLSNKRGFDNVLDQIRTIPVDKIIDEHSPSSNESAIIISNDREDEMEEIARRYQISTQQRPAIPQIIEEDQIEDKRSQVATRGYQGPYAPIQEPQRTQTENPITQMFRSAKRPLKIDFSIEINENIPRIDFIEMMEDSYDVSIIDFLSEEITSKICGDRDRIKKIIRDRINSEIKKAPKSESEKKKAPKKASRKVDTGTLS